MAIFSVELSPPSNQVFNRGPDGQSDDESATLDVGTEEHNGPNDDPTALLRGGIVLLHLDQRP